MAEYDPTGALRDLADAGARQAHPLEPEEIRRRGQHRRRTRRVVAGTGAVVAATAIAAAAFWAPGNLLGGQRVPITSSPTPTSTAAANLEPALLISADLPAGQGWTERPLTTPLVCVPSIEDWLSRDLAPEGGEGGGLRHGIGGPFASVDEAAAAVPALRDQAERCVASTRPVNLTDTWDLVGVPGFVMRWWGAPVGDGFGSRELVTTMVATSGRAVTVLAWGGPAQDANAVPSLDVLRTALVKLCATAGGDCSKEPTGLVRTFPAPVEDPPGLLTSADVADLHVPIASGADEPALDNASTVCAETPLAGAASTRGRGFSDEELVFFLYEAVGTYRSAAEASRAAQAIAAGYADCPDSDVPISKISDTTWTLRFGEGQHDTLIYVGTAQAGSRLVVLQWTATVGQSSEATFATALATAVERLGA